MNSNLLSMCIKRIYSDIIITFEIIQRRRLAAYYRLLDFLNRGELCDELLEQFPELSVVVKENTKLRYRAQILRASIAEQEQLNKKCSTKESRSEGPAVEKEMMSLSKNCGQESNMNKPDYHRDSKNRSHIIVKDFGSSLLCMLRALFKESIIKVYPEMTSVPVMITETTLANFGDYQFNSSMALAQKLKVNGHKISPREVAQKIIDNISKCDWIEKMEIAGPGYVNVFLSKNSISACIANIALKGINIPKIEKRRVIVDFSSPNIAKEMHVGHLRSTIIGESISRLLTYVGFDVLRLNHIGDWGTQFGMLIAHLQDRFPNFLNEVPPISDLQTFYKESKKRFDEDEAFKARSYQCVVKLQGFEPDYVKAWRMICDVSRKNFNEIYDRLEINIEERGESFYQGHMIDLVNELDSLGVLEVEDGRKILRVGDGVPLTVVKSDGGYTYDTSDLAALKYRLFIDKAEWIIYVVDAGQNLHFELVFAAGRKLGWYSSDKTRVEHVSFGLVLGEDKKKFKTRSGDTVRLSDLLDEGVKRAEAKLREKERDKTMTAEELASARNAVAYGCVRYADLSQTRTQDYVFSFDRMLDDRGNTAVYLLYAFARIKSICRSTLVPQEDVQNYLLNLPNGSLPLEHESEFKLAKAILKFSDCILSVLDSFLLHQLCDYIYALATTFHDFYNECYVIQKDVDEIYRKLNALCLNSSDTEEQQSVTIYLLDPHVLPQPRKKVSADAENLHVGEILLNNAVDEGVAAKEENCDRRNLSILTDQYPEDDMSIASSASDFEETLWDHFQNTPKSNTDWKSETDSTISSCFSPMNGFTAHSKLSDSPHDTCLHTSSLKKTNNKIPKLPGSKKKVESYVEGRKRRIDLNEINNSSYYEQFGTGSFVSSTPLNSNPNNERSNRLSMINSAVRTKVLHSKRVLRTLNRSVDSAEAEKAKFLKEEAKKREQGAIEKHIVRIRTSNSKFGIKKEVSPSLIDNDSRYYSMRSSFEDSDERSCGSLVVPIS
ncbi:unnamed protein product [Thelazia callipaeda]|uniref:Probable arginine--tRNA ligase, cytoplasmic n=1 Tax=Thelazia callipaeda TaxID=103827 RepID=A0A0N5DAN0_THECL|nr:unnamed protein product [Thelazia callipaeda]